MFAVPRFAAFYHILPQSNKDMITKNEPVILHGKKTFKKRRFLPLPKNIHVSDELFQNLKELKQDLMHKSYAQTLLYIANVYFKKSQKDEILSEKTLPQGRD
jgi:predicted CopG family antitoxin